MNMFANMGYIVFYTQEGFWAGESLNLTVLPSREFCKSLEEVYFEEINDDFKIFICKDGMIKFWFGNICKVAKRHNFVDKEIATLNNKLSHINAFLLLLNSEIKNKNISSKNFENIAKRDVFFTNGGSVKTAKFSYNYSWEKVKTREIYTYNPQAPVIWDERFNPADRSLELSTEVFSNAISSYKKLCTNDEAVYLLSDIQKALTLFDNGDYGNCLILLWSHLEIHYKELYLQCVKSANPRIGIFRVLEYLYDQGKLSLEKYERINFLKDIRNTIIHHDTNTDVSFQHCLELFDLVYDIANKKYQVGLDSDLYTVV